MKAALLNLAHTERVILGFVTFDTRRRLNNIGVSSADLEIYLTIAGS